MAKQRLNITIDEEVIKELKLAAQKNCHTVSNEIEYRMKYWSPQPLSTSVSIPTPENPTGQQHTPTAISDNTILVDGVPHKKHPLTWLRENNIDPMDISMETFHRFNKVFPDIKLPEFDAYQQSRTIK